MHVSRFGGVIGIGGLKRSGKDTLAELICKECELPVFYRAFADALRDTAAAAYGVSVKEFTDNDLKDQVHPVWGISRRQMLINLGVPALVLPPAGLEHWVKRWEAIPELVRDEKSYQKYLAASGQLMALCGNVASQGASLEEQKAYFTLVRSAEALLIAPDVRRVNEAAAVHRKGGINVLIKRSGVEWDGHVTEKLAAFAREDANYSYGDAEKAGLGSTDQPADRAIFDAVVVNDGSVEDLRPLAIWLLDMAGAY